jgi:hypothetical protein
MRTHAGFLLLACLAIGGASPAAAAPISMPFGKNIRKLQNLVDRRYGAGRINVTQDFIGARAGDADPFCWAASRTGAMRIRMLKRDPHQNRVGWYNEGGAQAAMPVGGGVLFSGGVLPGEEAWLLTTGVRSFGFYIDGPVPVLHGPRFNEPRPQPAPERFYTNRFLNDRGADGSGSAHPPFDGDVQALVFDLSPWVGTDAWLVCFEDRDTGGSLGEFDGDDEDDDGDSEGPGAVGGSSHQNDPDDGADYRHLPKNPDFDDVVFEVRADGATAARPLSFGALKLIYR